MADSPLNAGMIAAAGGDVTARAGLPLGNYSYGRLKRWGRGLSRVMTGSGHAAIAIAADSTGLGAGVDADPAQYRPRGVPVQMARQITAAGVPAQANNFFGAGARSNTQAASVWDNRRSRTDAWGLKIDTPFNVGGWATGADAAGSESFLSSGAIDTIDIWVVRNGNGAQSFTVSVDGGASLGTISVAQGSQALIKQTIPLAATTNALHAVTMTWVSGAVRVIGMDCYLSTAPSVHVLHMGAGGSSSADWAATAQGTNNPGYNIGSWVRPDLTVLNLGINNWLFGSAGPAAYQAELTSLATAIMANSDVLIVVPLATRSTGTGSPPDKVDIALQRSYQDAARATAVALGVPYVDWAARQVSWEEQSTLGMTADNVHPNLLGYGARVNEIVQAIVRP